MAPFEFLFNHIQLSVQESFRTRSFAPHEMHLTTDSVPETLALSLREGVLSADEWIAVAELFKNGTRSLRDAISNAVLKHLHRTTSVSEAGCRNAIDMWMTELVALVTSLRGDPSRLPKRWRIHSEIPPEKPLPSFQNEEELVGSLFVDDASKRLRACFRFLSDASLAKRHVDKLRCLIEHESNLAIKRAAERALENIGTS
jgi:hypothetical protein